ncbi:MAG: hypothetical protein M3Q19_11925 [Pseudomonadota bacterium]|nr:hypothetical protein [Pseudomonadota bacterium]
MATLFTVRRICLSQFRSESIARIAVALLAAGSFWLEYAVGVWPHMVSAFFAVQAFWFALRHLDSGGKEYRYAVLSGLMAGVGILFRLDAALAVPAIGLMIVLFAPRLVRSSCCFAAGVLPSLALLAGFNYLKFGTPNPFSYGRPGGNTDLAAYSAMFAALCVGFGAVVLWRKLGWKVDRTRALGSVAVLSVALLLIPATSALLLKFWDGLLTLVVDVRNLEDHRLGIERGPGNTLVAWGQTRKSLGQSMPWIGLGAMALTSPLQKENQRLFAMLFIFIAAMSMPFILLSWHGGGGSNMRYFLPVLPALSILCAKLISDLWTSVPKGMTFLAAGVWGIVGLCFAWTMYHPSRFAGVQQILSTYLLLVTALTAIAAGVHWRFRQAARRLAIAIFAAGVVMSTSFAVSDFAEAVERRASNYSGRLVLASLPPKSLVIAYSDWVGDRMPGNGSIIAARDEWTRRVDQQLILNALDAGYRVFMVSVEFDASSDVPAGVEPLATGYPSPAGPMIELRHRTRQQPTRTKSPLRSSEPSE